MRSICFYFQVHQPYRLKTYRFFDIGVNHSYFDDYRNRYIMRRIADKCYLPMNQLLLDLIKEYGTAFKVSFSISGTAMQQFEQFAPEVLASFQALARTGCVEFLAETYSHSLVSLKSKEEFTRQVNEQRTLINKHFDQDPQTFRNTELIYSDGIGEMVAEMGFKTMLTEGAKHILGWKSPNFMYCNAINPKLKILLKNFQLSDDIAFRFSQTSWNEWPLTTEKFTDWLNAIGPEQEAVNLFMDYETFGEHQWKETGIFEFMKALPAMVFAHTNFSFHTPGELSDSLQPVSAIHVPDPISWADEERDLTAWLGNELQDDAFQKLYDLELQVKHCHDEDIIRDWKLLQTSDHFYYMCTKWFSDGDVHKYFNPYNTPYEAYINFMNILADFTYRIEESINVLPDVEPVDKTEAKKAEKTRKKHKAVREPAIKVVSKQKTVKKLAGIKAPKATAKAEKISLKKVHQARIEHVLKLTKRATRAITDQLEMKTLYEAIHDSPARIRRTFISVLLKTELKEYQAVAARSGTVKASDATKAKQKLIEVMTKLR